jgi:aryl-alcohol dehydrogenase-like predicted oxidoreductase
MEVLVQQGKVLYVGSSNFAALHIAQAQCTARERRFMGLVCEQSLYNLNKRMIELEVIPACQSFGLGIIPWSPLDGGLLGGILGDEKGDRRGGEGVQKRLEKHLQQVERYEDLCRRIGERPADIALAWLLANPSVTAPIIGPRLLSQLDTCLRTLEIQLDESTLRELDEIWPGPGGSAPEAYAW